MGRRPARDRLRSRRHGAPCEESWLTAFGLIALLVWIHVEALRVLTFRRDDT
ncbi:Bax inhibitor-1/YccA family protein [Streptomyces sp. NPDC058964]|uniref:Bax inhibitor-1/YccA family membrane protein n=1 Tax=Streptomyces sp. NPDC058964 TaxID=3346681 RepID=UPI0036AB4BF3